MKLNTLKLGIIGGGQLGMFLAKAAKKINIEAYIYSNTKDAPAKKYAKKMYYGPFEDSKKLINFSKKVDVITYEFENISVESLRKIKKTKHIFPPINALSIAQNREFEKKFFLKNKISHAKSFFLNTKKDLNNLKNRIRYPVILKTSRFGYDGKGQFEVKNFFELNKFWKDLNFAPCIVEKKIKLKKELSVVCVRDQNKNIFCYPTFRNIHKNHILFETYSPSGINKELEKKLINISKKIIKKLNYIGVLTIEFFIDANNKIYANELAPRVHNSGHITLDNSDINQFDQHIRAVSGMNLIDSIELKYGLMRNLIGKEIKLKSRILKEKRYKTYSKVKIYSYNKNEAKEGRKMGHINFTKQ
mgnify:CR=1 FL=1|tara:strand:+ start:306 stop:1385 length:1080 start_codon:yes stop_codon:yes gene_type:complete